MSKMYSNKLTIALLMAPAVILFLVFIPIPTLYLFGISFFKYDMLNTPEFIGFGNYKFLFTKDPYFWNALKNNFVWMTGNILCQMIPAFFFAWMLSKRFRGANFFKSTIFLPVALSSTAVSTIWYFVYHGKVGLLNQIIRQFGNQGFDKSWLLDEKFALFGVMIAVAWQWVGYYMVLFLSGFSTIPNELVESAKIDGANEFTILRKIILPYMSPIINVIFVLICVSAFKGFDSIYVMTKGGPNHASELLAINMYEKSFTSGLYGYGSSIAVIIVMFCVFITLFINRLFKRTSLGD